MTVKRPRSRWKNHRWKLKRNGEGRCLRCGVRRQLRRQVGRGGFLIKVRCCLSVSGWIPWGGFQLHWMNGCRPDRVRSDGACLLPKCLIPRWP